MKNALKKIFTTKKGRIIGAAVLLVVILIIIGMVRGGSPQDEGDIAARVRQVDVIAFSSGTSSALTIVGSGELRAANAADLVAESSGAVKGVHVSIGDTVSRGQILVSLSSADAVASVAQAEAQLAAARAVVRSEETTLANSELSVKDAIENAVVKADEALRYRAAQLFSNPEELTGFGVTISQGDTTYFINSGSTGIHRSARKSLGLLEDLEARVLADDSYDVDDAYRAAEEMLLVTRSFLDEISLSINENVALDVTAQSIYDKYKNDISSARTSVNTALTTLRTAKQSQRAANVAIDDSGVQQAQASLQAAQATLAKTAVRAPFSGKVLSVSAKLGEYLSIGAPAVSLISSSDREVEMHVTSDDAGNIAVGDSALVDGTYRATVIRKAPGISADTGKVEVILALDASAGGLATGEFVEVEIVPQGAGGDRYVPLKAVRNRTDVSEVFVIEDGVVSARAVTLGDVQGDKVRVISGLESELAIISNVRGLQVGDVVEIRE